MGKILPYVYCLTHPCMPGVVKVGFTTKDPTARARELSGATGVPGHFAVAWARECDTPRLCEYNVHQALARYRVSSRREFFRCDVATAKAAIEKHADAYLRGRYRVPKQRYRYRKASTMRYLWLGASACALIAAVTHPTSAWIILERVFRLAISIGYLGHHRF